MIFGYGDNVLNSWSSKMDLLHHNGGATRDVWSFLIGTKDSVYNYMPNKNSHEPKY